MLKRCLTGVAAVILVLVLIVWHLRWTITGQVVDAETGEPIENAVVNIKWLEPGPGPPGMRATVTTEEAEDVSDAKGRFKLPKYSSLLATRRFRMAIYKKGYICWSSVRIFPKEYIWTGKEWTFPTMKKRTGFTLDDGMIIRMEPFKEQYSREMHALFTTSISAPMRTGLFSDAIAEETKLSGEIARKNWEK